MKSLLKFNAIAVLVMIFSLSFTACDNEIINKNITYSVASDQEVGKDTTKLLFIFSEPIAAERISMDDITLTKDTGEVTKESLHPINGRYWELNVTTVKEGNIKAKITCQGIETGEKTVIIYKKPSLPSS